MAAHTQSRIHRHTHSHTDVGKTERERGRQTVRQTYRQPRVLARLGTALYQHLADWLALTWVKGVGWVQKKQATWGTVAGAVDCDRPAGSRQSVASRCLVPVHQVALI